MSIALIVGSSDNKADDILAAVKHVLLGRLRMLLSRVRQWIFKLKQGLFSPGAEEAPGEAELARREGMKLLAPGHYEESIPFFDKSIQLNPNCANSYHHRALAYYESGGFEKAVQDWLQVLSLKGPSLYTYRDLGNAYEKLGELEQACEMYSCEIEHVLNLEKSGWRIKDAFPDDLLFPLYMKRAKIQERLGKQKESDEDHERAKALKPRFPNQKQKYS